jgi:hypothetical protein
VCVCVCICVCVCEWERARARGGDVDGVYLILCRGWWWSLDFKICITDSDWRSVYSTQMGRTRGDHEQLKQRQTFQQVEISKQPYLLISTVSVVPASTALREYLWDGFPRDHFPLTACRVREGYHYVHDMQLLPCWRRLRDLPKQSTAAPS